MLESHLVLKRQFLYRHLVDVGMSPVHKMWPNEGVHMVGSESNHTRRAQKQSEGREPRFFALVSALFFPRQFFSRALNALIRLSKMWKQQQQQSISINAGWKSRQKFYQYSTNSLKNTACEQAFQLGDIVRSYTACSRAAHFAVGSCRHSKGIACRQATQNITYFISPSVYSPHLTANARSIILHFCHWITAFKL